MKTYARHTETLDSCFDRIRLHQQCIPWSHTLEIGPATTDCNIAETLLLRQQSISHTLGITCVRYGLMVQLKSLVMVNVEYSNSKITGDTVIRNTKGLYSNVSTISWQSDINMRREENLVRFYQHISLQPLHQPVSQQRPILTSLFGFQNSTALIFKLSYFYIFSNLITYTF